MKKTIFTTALLLLGLFVGALKTNAQVGRRTVTIPGTQTNAFYLPISGNNISSFGYYLVAQTSTGNGDILVMRYDGCNSVIWEQVYGNNNDNDLLSACLVDANGDLVVLANNMSANPRHFELLKVDEEDGSEIFFNRYTQNGQTNNIIGATVKEGANGHYYIAANLYSGADYSTAHIVELTAAGGIVADRSFSETHANYSNIAFYDIAQLNDGRWVACGTTRGGDYKSAAWLISANLTAINASYSYDINNGHDNFDKVVVNSFNNDIYLASSANVVGTGDEIGIMKLNGAFAFQWYNQYAINGNQRVHSIAFDPFSTSVIVSSINSNGNDYGLVMSVTQAGVLNYMKALAGMTSANTNQLFRMFFEDNAGIQYSTTLNGDIIYGSMQNSAFAGTCDQLYAAIAPTHPGTQVTPTYGVADVAYVSAAVNSVTNLSSHTFTVDCGSQCTVPVGDFTPIDNQTISTTTYWGGNSSGSHKYFVTGQLRIQAGATLDITNIDVVLQEQAKIIVEPGANLIINNSVLRPCNELGTWDGIEFSGFSTATINNSTFIRAVNAIRVQNGSNNVKLTNNQFNNCIVAFRAENVVHGTGSITNNVFFVENQTSTCVNSQPAEYTGIYTNLYEGELVISQNEFIYAASDVKTERFFGIYAVNSNSMITENTFTNCYRAVDIENPKNSYIENNDIEVNNTNSDYTYQLRLSSVSDAVEMVVAHNSITNYNLSASTMGTADDGALYVENSIGFNIFGNEIEGFDVGMYMQNITNGLIYSNIILNAKSYGMYINTSDNSSVKCNEINLNYRFSDNISTGIYYDEVGFPGVQDNLEIAGNCIRNTRTAIGLHAFLIGTTLPRIENNYLYSYIDYGVYNENFANRNIGENLSGASGHDKTTLAGRNTFISNNQHDWDGAIDVYSNQPIEMWGNFNAKFVSNIIYVGSNDDYYSTTACGNFFIDNITYVPRIERGDKCDSTDFVKGKLFFGPNPGPDRGIQNLDEMIFEMVVKTKSDNERIATWASALKVIANSNSDINIFLTKVDKYETNEAVKHLTHAYGYCVNGEYAKAEAALASVNTGNDVQLQNTKERITLLIEIYKNDKSIDVIQMEEFDRLIAESDFFATELRVAIDPSNHSLYFPFPKPAYRETLPVNHNGMVKHVGENNINVYPNPANGNEVNVDVSTPGITSSVIYIRDVTGRVVGTQQVNVSMGTVKVSVADLISGVYFVSVESDEGVIATEKLIVTH